MASTRYVLVLDQGSTSSRAVLYDHAGGIAFLKRAPLETLILAPDRVEHDPSTLFGSQMRAFSGVRRWLGQEGERTIAAVGIANQRSTFLLWDRRNGKPFGRFISWQDRRGEEARVEMARHQDQIQRKTGLRVTPHSPIAKLRWVFRHVRGARKRAEAGDLLFGTVNTYLIWRLTGGGVHATDHTNASRTLMMNLRSREWDPELLSLFGIPRVILPRILPTSALYGEAAIGRRAVPILASIGDQQASLCGQGGFEPDHLALTYGTGGFLLWNVGERPQTRTALLSTAAWSSAASFCYGLEGTVNAVGSAILWLKDLGWIAGPAEIDALCDASRQEVAFVPSLSGLGSPYYRPVETALFGLKRTTTRADLVRGLMAGIAFLMKDNYDRMTGTPRCAAPDHRGRRRGALPLAPPVPGGSLRKGDRPLERLRDHPARRGLPGRPRVWILEEPREPRPSQPAGEAVQAEAFITRGAQEARAVAARARARRRLDFLVTNGAELLRHRGFRKTASRKPSPSSAPGRRRVRRALPVGCSKPS
ncbi:MAG TPA: FGGY family carbohydrate kinase [Thermoanaerobaculia bacterium]